MVPATFTSPITQTTLSAGLKLAQVSSPPTRDKRALPLLATADQRSTRSLPIPPASLWIPPETSISPLWAIASGRSLRAPAPSRPLREQDSLATPGITARPPPQLLDSQRVLQ